MIMRTLGAEFERICMGFVYAVESVEYPVESVKYPVECVEYPVESVAYPGDDVPHLLEWVLVRGVFGVWVCIVYTGAITALYIAVPIAYAAHAWQGHTAHLHGKVHKPCKHGKGNTAVDQSAFQSRISIDFDREIVLTD
jgi:hypothetical protein